MSKEYENDDETEIDDESDIEIKEEEDVSDNVEEESEDDEDSGLDEEDDEEQKTTLDEISSGDIMSENNYVEVKGDDRITRNVLTIYERVRILGARVNHLSRGAKPIIDNIERMSFVDIAEKELSENKIPFKVKRYLPNNTYEIWHMSELEKDIYI
jgi:DNA-directed RNA polymerase I, II, and III subunit RPABC2